MPTTNEAVPASAADFAIERTFQAPRALVWKAWSDAEALQRWWGPRGWGLEIAKLDFRPGGVFHYRMHMPDGKEMWGRFRYREIAEPERIVYVSSFSDAAGAVTRAPFAPTFPLELLNTVVFTETAGATKLTLRGSPIDANPEERAFFAGMFGSMQQGFGGTFDQLDTYLATERANNT